MIVEVYLNNNYEDEKWAFYYLTITSSECQPSRRTHSWNRASAFASAYGPKLLHYSIA